MNRTRRIIAGSLGALGVLIVLAALLGLLTLRASLPPLDGTLTAAGLHGPVTLERDALGIVTATASTRADLAFATGFAHGQDRFFQMDLARRLAAGELAELVGSGAVTHDESTRRFRFRHLALTQLAQAGAAERAALEAYARGVNAGLASLRARPWEYWVLRAHPAPWRAEDTLLATDAMWWDLQSEWLERELLRQRIDERLGGAVCADGWKCALSFFYPARTVWDAPIDAPAAAPAIDDAEDVPGPEALDLRTAAQPAADSSGRLPMPAPALGSNSWAISGRLTATGAALLASDMHLAQRVPATWYRMRLRLVHSDGTPALDLNGLTLPGAPVLVAGSNGHVAWAFTNSYGTWFSLRHVACTAIEAHLLRTSSGEIPIARFEESIHVHGAAERSLEVIATADELLLQADPAHQVCWLGAWLAQRPDATNLRLIDLETARTVPEALALAPSIGIPHQNLLVADAEGHIGWSIAGRIPRDTGPLRARAEIPWTDAAEHPSLIDPPSGRLWTANARVISDARIEALIGADLAPLGAEYDLGARAQQIRDDLLALDHPATPADMLQIQLDDRARFLAHWHRLLLELLDDAALSGRADREAVRAQLLGWNGRASVDSGAYRIVRAFRDRTRNDVWSSLLSALRLPADAHAPIPPQFEHALWLLVREQPMHLLDPRYASWRQFLLAELDATAAAVRARCGELTRCTWGERNTVAIRHPLSAALPGLAWLIDMPALELPGDDDMPRVQVGAVGASERFAVSPGREAQGYLHLPGGQSGHPLSPYYRAGFMAWARGEPLPFLPGPPQHRLQLQPVGLTTPATPARTDSRQ